MLNSIIAFSIRNKLIIGLFTIGLIVYGSFQFTLLPIDAVPDITDNQVQVITVTPSLGAPDVERLITFPIEQANSNIPGLKEMRSFSRFGLSLITIVFEDDVDIYWARQQITERLKLAEEDIPKGLGTPSLAPVTTGLGEIYQYVLRPMPGYEQEYDATKLRTIQDWVVRRQLLGVKGVADVSSFGGRVKQYEIAVNPASLKANDVTINEVFNALEQNNENTGGAYIEKASTVLYIRSEGLVGNLEDIQSIRIKSLSNGTPVLIRDVADVRIGQATRYGSMTYNDVGEVAGAVVMMLKGDNSNLVIDAVKERIESIKNTLPEGVILEPFLDRSKMVKSAIGTVRTNLLEGALIVVFILVLFLGNLRAGLLVASVIPLSMLFAVIMMNQFGVSGNLMSLGALDFGLIVDGTVIIVEAVMHKLHGGKDLMGSKRVSQAEMDDAVKQSAGRMMNSAVFGQIIILVVYLPILTLEGIEGKMFKPMAQTVAFALLGAFVLSLTYVPVMSSLFLSKSLQHKRNFSDRMMDFFTRHHLRLFKKVLDYPKITLTAVITLFVLSIGVFTQLGGEFIPELPEGDFAVDTRVLPGSNLTTSSEAVMKSSSVLLGRFPEIEKIVAKTGSGEIPTDPMPMEASDMMIILKDKEEWTSASSWDELAEKMSAALTEIPGVTYSFQYPVAMRFNELMTGSKQDVVCKIFGENLDTLSKYARRLGDQIVHVDGAQDLYVEPIDGLPQAIIRYNRKAMAQYGLSVQEVNKVVNTAFAGERAGLVFEDEKRFDLVVRLADEVRSNLDDIRNVLIPTESGTQIPLNQVASVQLEESVNQIQRDDAKRRITVGFNVRGRDVQSIVKEVQKNVDAHLNLPAGYYVTYGGAFENLQAAQARLSIAVPISLLLIFLFLYFAFGSVKQGLLIYSAIPLSAIGGILFLALRGLPFSISAGVGFIALFGVAVLNGIVLLAEFNRIKQSGIHDPREIVLEGTRHRLRPVLMTAFVASLGFLPMAISTGAGAEVQRPLATVVIGGLLIATFLTLFVLPTLYILFETMGKRKSMPPTAILFAVIGLSFLGTSHTSAQTRISYQSALDTAVKNNYQIQNARLLSTYQEKLKASAIDLPATQISGDYGRFNSNYTDNGVGLSQAFQFPTVYLRQQAQLNLQYAASKSMVRVQEAELKKEVGESYYTLWWLEERRNMLAKRDSLMAAFQAKSQLRFEQGESNVLEKTSVDLQRGRLSIERQSIETQLSVEQVHFQLLMNSEGRFLPQSSSPQLVQTSLADSTLIDGHPHLIWLSQQITLAESATRLERARLLPEIELGYYSMTMQGTGADNMNYTRSTRFNSVQGGIRIPIFYQHQKAKIKAAQTEAQMALNDFEAAKHRLSSLYESALLRLLNQRQTVDYYEQTALPHAQALMSAADEQFRSGEIDYLHWSALINQALDIENQYLDVQFELNQTILEINYLTNN
ncbi:MAG: CusA/CzcA family heavy metal efflux RND transporter [Bacteroidetes bacterium]|nr:CusA/CzcA family heavy metal efflux RND transporter [Bacteroidota bacterium]